MANSYIEYNQNLSETTYDVPFNFLSIDDVNVKGYDGSAWSDLTVSERDAVAKTVKLDGAPSAYQKIRVWRNTGTTQLVDFQNGSRLSESDLDTAYQQGLFVAQEVSENASTEVEGIGPQGVAGNDGADGADGADGVDGTNASPFPTGSVIYHAANTAPTGFLKADGSAVSRSTYSDLFAAIGETYGAGDGSTTFLVPDLRGEFMRGWDDSRGIDSGRSFGSAQADELKSHNHVSGVTTNNDGTELYGAVTSGISTNDSYSQNTTNGNRSGYTSSTGGSETRPRNVALLACIKF
jgi:microcystin-dependent protein